MSIRGSQSPKVLVRLDRLFSAIAAGMIMGWGFVGADVVAREGWGEVDRVAHAEGSLALYGAVGASLGVVAWLVAAAVYAGERRVTPSYPRLSRWLIPIGTFLVALVWLRDTAHYAFSGHGVQGSVLARVGPYLLLVALATGLAIQAALVRHGLLIAARRPGRALLIGVTLGAASAALATVDLTVYVALYQRLHVLLETLAGLAAIGGAAVVITTLRARFPMRRAFAGFALAGLLLTTAFVSLAALRKRVDDRLSHVWSEPAYVGRMLMRTQLVEAFLHDPAGWHSARASRLGRLKERYDISNTAIDPTWQKPQSEPAAVTQSLAALRKRTQDFNVVVFYIDTLRHDVASDPQTMPNLVGLAKDSINFKHAYSFASDTVTAMPVLIGGSYIEKGREDSDIFAAAERAHVPSALFIAKSARRFLNELVPAFRFDQTVDVQDYPNDKPVWGYGADRSSARGVVDEALDWIDHRTSERFFAWLFHFDVHNWRELEDGYVDDAAQRLGIDDSRPKLKRYKAVAAGVDEALGQFLAGLKARGLDDKTIVLAVADHGEALGRRGHWVHAVFLWESLVRTPLVLHVPGLEPRVVDAPVGHVDVAPTLARFLDPDSDVSPYHGYDLLRHVVGGAQDEQLPLLLMSMRKEDVLRVGLIDRHDPSHKLVLPLDSAEPELHDLNGFAPDDLDLARQRRTVTLDLLSKLVRSPVFPREEEPTAEGDRTAALH